MIRWHACLVAVAAAFLLGRVDGRTWTSPDGRTMEAEFVRMEGDSVFLKMASGNGRVVKLEMDQLSTADQEHVHELVREQQEELVSDPRKYFSLSSGDRQLSVPKIDDKRLTYDPKGSWIFLSIASSARSGFSNLSHSGSITLTAGDDLQAMAEQERGFHGRNHDEAEILDVVGGGKMLVYTTYEKDGRSLRSRRCFLWLAMDDGVVRLDFEDNSFDSPSGRSSARDIITRTLEGTRVNLKPLRVLETYTAVLFGGDPEDHAEVLDPVDEGGNPGLGAGGMITLKRGGHEVTAMRATGKHLEYSVTDRSFAVVFYVEDREPGSAPHIDQTLRVALEPAGDLRALAKKERERDDGIYDAYLERVLPSGERLLFYTRYGPSGRKQTTRRCIVWKDLGDVVLKVDGNENVFTRNSRKDQNDREIRATLGGVRLNGQALAATPVFLDFLLIGESSAFANDPLVR